VIESSEEGQCGSGRIARKKLDLVKATREGGKECNRLVATNNESLVK
jgi:hypothetical protein